MGYSYVLLDVWPDSRQGGCGRATPDRSRTILARSTDFDFGESVTATTELLTLADRPTAIFATSDAQALGVIEAARALKISVPEDLSIVSFDDTSAAAMASPPLTAVRQPFEELGQVATRLLVDAAAGKPPVTDRFELATTLTIRLSTAPAPPAGAP